MALATSGRSASPARTRLAHHAMSLAVQNAANVLTLLRLVCVPPIVALTLSGRFREAAVLFVLAALTDLADGYVAKRISGTSALGAALDPVADKLLMASLFLALLVEGHLPIWLAALVIGRDLLIVAGTLALRLLIGPFRIAPLLIGKLATFLQLVLGGAILLELSLLPQLEPVLQPLMLVTAAVIVASALAYVHAAARIRALARSER